MTMKLARRTFLKGLGGFGVALPALEIMSGSAAHAATAIPKRFLISFGGMSIASDADNGQVAPTTVGRNYDLRRGLAPIGALGVKDDITVVSGLKIPWMTGGVMPPAGRTVYFHYNTLGPQIAGTYAGNPGAGDYERDGTPKGSTCDQLVADAIGTSTAHKVLTYRVQVGTYINYAGSDNSTSGGSLVLSFRKDAGGGVNGVVPTFSPQLAYRSLFSGFTPSDPAEVVKAKALLARRRSVLDLVHWKTERLLPQLGKTDAQRLERHFDEIRALENRLASIPEVQGACKLPTDPGSDPPIGGSSSIYNPDGTSTYVKTAGYSDEDKRADIFTDLIAMAFACDLTRSASFMLTEWKCYMNMFQIAGWESDVHGCTHAPLPDGIADGVAWHVKQLARITKKLKALPEIDGSTVLDHSALVLVFEGGHGFDPEGNAASSSHSTENMVALIAGRAGGLKSGQHIVATDKHPGQVVVSAMDAVGVTGGMGELRTGLPELFTG